MKRNSTIRVAKTKALTSFAFIAKLVCTFVFAQAKILFSHDAAQFMLSKMSEIKRALYSSEDEQNYGRGPALPLFLFSYYFHQSISDYSWEVYIVCLQDEPTCMRIEPV